MKINENLLEEVGDLVDVDPNGIKQKKSKNLLSYLIYYFIQVFVFLFSSLMGYLFVLWEYSDRSTYPYTTFSRHTILGSISLFTLHGGNVIHSYFYKKRYKRRFVEVYPTILVNLILSFISFFMIFNALYQDPFVPLGIVVDYGVFRKEEEKNM